DTYGANARPFEAREVVVKIGLRHDEMKALDIFSREFAHPGVAMAQGLTGVLHGRPKPAPVLRVHSLLWPKDRVPLEVRIGEETIPVAVPASKASEAPPRHPAPEMPIFAGPTETVPLRALAWG